ncbi:unnamed protein product [Closterium sp. NIES-53]
MSGDEKKMDLSDIAAALPSGGAGLTDEARAELKRFEEKSLRVFLLFPPPSRLGPFPSSFPGLGAEIARRAQGEVSGGEGGLGGQVPEAVRSALQPVNFVSFVCCVSPPHPLHPWSRSGVPEFWLTAMKNNEILAEQITARDEPALKHLKDIRWSQLGEELKVCALGTEIEWNAGKNLTQKIMKKKPKKGAKSSKPITKTEPCESFFNFFSPPAVPTEEEELDEEEVRHRDPLPPSPPHLLSPPPPDRAVAFRSVSS